MKTRIISFLSAAALLAGCYEDAGELGVDTATRIALSPAEIGSGENFPYRLELIDKTTVKPVLSSLESDVSLKGVFCRKMQERGGFADGEDISDIVALAMKYGLSALEDRGFSNLTEAHDEQ